MKQEQNKLRAGTGSADPSELYADSANGLTAITVESISLSSTQRAALRSLANGLEPILHIGKEGATQNVQRQLDEALEARELVKCTVQKNCASDARTVCRELSCALGAAEVQVIGRRFVVFRPSKKDPRIII